MWEIPMDRPGGVRRFPIVVILVAVLILAGILGMVSYQNFTSSKKQMIATLRTHAQTLIRAFEAGARTGMMGMMWSGNQIQTLIEETGKEENVNFIAITDDEGYVLAHSDRSKVGQVLTGAGTPIDSEGTSPFEESLRLDSAGTRTYEIRAPFNPVSQGHDRMMTEMMNRNAQERWMRWCRMMSPGGQSGTQYIVLSLRMDQYELARMQDVKRGLLTGGILFVVGIAAFYFLLAYQSYASTHRAFQNVQTFATNVVESMPNGLISLDTDGKVTILNRKAAEILGLDRERSVGCYLSDVMKACNMEATFLPAYDVMEKRVDCPLEEGKVIPLSITTSALRNRMGEDIGRVIILRDLREIEKLQDQLKRSEHLARLGEMAAGIAHEMRNPLSSIRGFMRYFRKQFPEGSEQDEYAEAMVKEVGRLNRVIQDMLEFSKPMKINLAEGNIPEIIDHSLRLVRSDLEDKAIHVQKNVDPMLPAIKVDDRLMTQALLNLFLNAIEAMEPGGELTIDSRVQNGLLELAITDTGSGIQERDRERVFDPFFSTKADGVGLGLSIVHRIVEGHGGEIKVDSAKNKGTRFTLSLPLTTERDG